MTEHNTNNQQTPTPQNVHVVVNPAQNGVLERNPTVAILLAIFLGWLGVDRFYLGSAGVGVLKLFTLMFGFITIKS